MVSTFCNFTMVYLFFCSNLFCYNSKALEVWLTQKLLRCRRPKKSVAHIVLPARIRGSMRRCSHVGHLVFVGWWLRLVGTPRPRPDYTAGWAYFHVIQDYSLRKTTNKSHQEIFWRVNWWKDVKRPILHPKSLNSGGVATGNRRFLIIFLHFLYCIRLYTYKSLSCATLSNQSPCTLVKKLCYQILSICLYLNR